MTQPYVDYLLEKQYGDFQEIARDAGNALKGLTTTAPYVFVFRAGGTAGANVFTDWPTLYAAARAVQGTKLIQVDGTFAECHVPVGAWDIDGWVFQSFQSQPRGNQGYTLFFDDGATVAAFQQIILDGVFFQSNSTSPVTTVEQLQFLFLTNDSEISCTQPNAPFFDVQTAAGFLTCALTIASFFGDEAQSPHLPVIRVGAGAHFYALITQTSTVNPNAFTSGSDNTHILLQVDASGSVQPSTGVVLTPAIQFVDDAAQVAFEPSTPADWNPAPTTAAEALDQLAVPAVAAAQSNPTTAATVTVSQAITKAKSGLVVVVGQMTATGSAAGTMTLTIKLDGVDQGVLSQVPTTDGGVCTASIAWPVQLPDAASHTISIVGAASSGTLNVASGGAQIVLTEA